VTRYDKTAYATTVFFIGLGVLTCLTTFGPPARPQTNNGTTVTHPGAIPVLPAASAAPSAYDPVTARPLFLATRKPPKAAPAKPVDYNAAPAAAPFSLIGVVAIGGKNLATVRRKSDLEATTLTVGQTIDGWTVTNIAGNAVFMQSGDTGQVLRLADDKDNTTKTK
jgi:hypothetical protein